MVHIPCNTHVYQYFLLTEQASEELLAEVTTRNDSIHLLCHFISSATEGCLAVVYMHSTSQIVTVFVNTAFQHDVQHAYRVPDGKYTIALFGITLSCREHEQHSSVLERKTIVAILDTHEDEGDGSCVLHDH